jgi:molecular chaperone GrpE
MSVKRKKKDLADGAAADGDDSAPSPDAHGPSRDGTGGDAVRSDPAGVAASEAGYPGGPSISAEEEGEPLASPGGAPLEAAEAARALAARVGELENQLAEARDQLLRKAADFDNFRKRMARDKEESVRFANAALVVDLIDAMDGLGRAISSTESSQDFASLHQGVVLIEKQLMDSLERKWGLKRMSSAGKAFDPSLHQAITVGEPAAGDEQLVLEEYQSGYLLHERVVRPAKVKVSAPQKSRSSVAASEGSESPSAAVEAAGAGSPPGGNEGGNGSGGQGR